MSETKASEPLPGTFLSRNEFLLRRLHSLSGVVPVGAYMVVHLLTNSTILDSPMAFQRNVYTIHSLGMVLPLVEWVFIFIPLLFHAIFGVIIIRGGLPNNSTYKYTSNMRYTLQRVTGILAFAFIVWHVFHMHGWIHAEWWTKGIATPLWGYNFRPYNAASTAAEAIAVPGSPATALVVQILYAAGILSCVYHLANGIWTFGITWGLWITPQAQHRATIACAVFGVALSVVGLSALGGFATMTREKIDEVRKQEMETYKLKSASGDVAPNEHKLWHDPKTEHAKAASTP